MMELGNTVINSIYEANYMDDGTDDSSASASPAPTASKIVRATPECDINVRETWIKAKYIDKSFVIPLNELHLRSAILEETNCLSDIIFGEDGMWHIQQRRGNSITLREDNKQSVNEDSASSSELSIDSNLADDELSIDSNGSDEKDETLTSSVPDSIDHLNSDVLLYNAAAIRHVPIMCYALACGASQHWTNENDTYRTALHRAVLSVSS